MNVKTVAICVNLLILIMANGNRRIPRSDSELNRFILNTTRVLLHPGPPNNWERLGMTEQDRDDWKALHDEWVAIYAKHTDAAMRNSTVVAEKEDVRKRFTKFTYNHLVRAQSLTTITAADREVFRIPLRKKTNTKRASIHDAPFVQFYNKPGGRLEVRARVMGAAGRAHIHPLADCMEIRYIALPIGAQPPEVWSECMELESTTKAISILKLKPDQLGKKIYAFCRWANRSEHEKSGPWSTRIEAIVA